MENCNVLFADLIVALFGMLEITRGIPMLKRNIGETVGSKWSRNTGGQVVLRGGPWLKEKQESQCWNVATFLKGSLRASIKVQSRGGGGTGVAFNNNCILSSKSVLRSRLYITEGRGTPDLQKKLGFSLKEHKWLNLARLKAWLRAGGAVNLSTCTNC